MSERQADTPDTKKSRKKECRCFEQAQKALKPYNTELVTHFLMNFKTGKSRMSHPSVVTAKLNSKSRQPAKTVFCTYCPFCGKKYPNG